VSLEDVDVGRGFDPAATVRPLSGGQLALLAAVGEHWRRTVIGRRAWRRVLPVATDLIASPVPGPGRFTRVAFARGSGRRGEVVATAEGLEPDSVAGRMLFWVRRAVIGPPLRSAAIAQERMRKLVALPVLASDALSSVAYGPEAMMTVLVLAGSGALSAALPIAAAIAVLMLAVGLSYRQTVRAYPGGGGSYIVASDNLGELAGLFAAAGLMIDYVLTVAVSVAAGIAAVTSAVPGLHAATVPLGLGVIAILVMGNLRGVREAGLIFAWPTYAFILAVTVVVGVGLVDAGRRGFGMSASPPISGTTALGVVLVLRAFSSGATAMTGIEAISNAIPAFQEPTWRNARITLTCMIGLLIAMFGGIVALIHFDGIIPQTGETMLSQLAHRSVGSGAVYVYVQGATALVLLLAANTAFNDFPRLLFFMARDARAPAVFLRMGDRLAFSNGIVALAVVSAIAFAGLNGNTESLIPLYAVGVFLAFTLSQFGMVVHWRRRRGPHWRKSIAFNAVGCALSAIVLVISAATKFMTGAWTVVVAVPLLVVIFRRIHRYYERIAAEVALRPPPPENADRVRHPIGPHRSRPVEHPPSQFAADGEVDESPEELRHLVIVPLAAFDLASMRALAYAASLGEPVLAVHISPNDAEAARFEGYWKVWGDHLPLEVVVSPYRAVVVPLARYIESLHRQRPELTFTVVVPELVAAHVWQRLLHGGIAARLRRSLRRERRVVVTTIPFVLSG